MAQPKQSTNPSSASESDLHHNPTTGTLTDADDVTRLVWIPEELVQALQAVAGRMLHCGARTLLEAIGLEWGSCLGARLGSSAEVDDPVEPRQLEQWLREVDALFARHGLGRLVLGTEGGHQVVRSDASFVARVTAATGRPVCHLYSGLLADLFGAFHGRDLDCHESRCLSSGHHHCTFVLAEPTANTANTAAARLAKERQTDDTDATENDARDTNEIEISSASNGAANGSAAGSAASFVRRDPVSGTATNRDGIRVFLAPLGFLLGLDRATETHAPAHAERLRFQLGYDWGLRHYRNSERILASRDAGETRIPDLPIGEFVSWLDHGLGAAGWGRLALSESGGRIFVRLEHSAVAAAASTFDRTPQPACHLWAGMFAGVFSGAAGSGLSCTEVRCAAAGAQDCRFLLDLEEVVEPVRRLVARGASYAQVLRGLDPSDAIPANPEPTDTEFHHHDAEVPR